MDVAVFDIAFAALPDGQTAVVLQRARAPHRAHLEEVKGLHLPVPNDVYNGHVRHFAWEGRTCELRGRPRRNRYRALTFEAARWGR